MCTRMQCRGPDAAGFATEGAGQVLLGHRRLAIIDLSAAGNQPMRCASGELAIAFNGEIYNYRELRRDLLKKGHTFRSESDTEVLLHLYAERGAEMVKALRGMFAFALWDQRAEGLLLARDPFGIKPLYYADDGRCIRIASEVKALLAGGGIDTAPDAAGHAGFFLWGHVPEPHTLYRGIRALPAGSTLWIDRGGAREPARYHDVGAMLAGIEEEPVTAPRSGELRERLRCALLDSVRHHLVADVDVGVFLSSGLDSTTLARLASEIGGNLRTITLGFEEFRGTNSDETHLAELVARQSHADHKTVWITRDEFHRELPRLLDRMDQPTIDGVNSYFVARAAASAGLKVALSGLGGDELFGGYSSFREIPRLVSCLRRLPAGPRIGRGIRTFAAPLLRSFTSPKYAGLLEYGRTLSGAYLLRRSVFMPWELTPLIGEDLALEGLRELASADRLTAIVDGISTDHFRISALEASWYMRNQLLRDTDWASMSHSLEVRVPLVDVTLWGEVARLIHTGAMLPKRAMAETTAQPLPAAVLTRAKTGFQVPTREWMKDRLGARPERGLRGWAQHVYSHMTAA